MNPAVVRTHIQIRSDTTSAMAPKLTGEVVLITLAKPLGTAPPAEGKTNRARPSIMLHVAIVTMNALIPR